MIRIEDGRIASRARRRLSSVSDAEYAPAA
jgi:hypothetical protein